MIPHAGKTAKIEVPNRTITQFIIDELRIHGIRKTHSPHSGSKFP